MCDQPCHQIALRPAGPDDCHRVWEWRNEAETREASFDTDFILLQDHERWFKRKILSADTKILIMLDPNHHEIGYVRFDIRGDCAEISVSVDKYQRGKGYGAAAIQHGSLELLTTTPVKCIVAYVKRDNLNSIGAFRKAGFHFSSTDDTGDAKPHKMVYQGAKERKHHGE